MSFLEVHSAVVYPLIALLVVTMVIAGVLQAWRGRDLAGLSRVELKREVLLALRRGDRTVEAVARHPNLSVEEAKALIAELRRDGILPPEDE